MIKIRSIIAKLRGTTDIDTLKKKGLTVGENVFVNFGSIIDESFCFLIEIGNNVTLAPNVHILAHDASTKKFLGFTKVGAVTIGNNVFLGAGTIVLPGVNVGDNVVVGAGSVVTHDIPSNSLAVGNPCRVINSCDEYLNKSKRSLDDWLSNSIHSSISEDFIEGMCSEQTKSNLKQEMKKVRKGFVR